MLSLRLLGSLGSAAIHADRIAALAIALLDNLATGERAGALWLRRERVSSLVDAAGERAGECDGQRELVHALKDTPSG